jgi:hypothetical protein
VQQKQKQLHCLCMSPVLLDLSAPSNVSHCLFTHVAVLLLCACHIYRKLASEQKRIFVGAEKQRQHSSRAASVLSLAQIGRCMAAEADVMTCTPMRCAPAQQAGAD